MKPTGPLDSYIIVSFSSVVFLLHLSLQIIIWRARLQENKYYLIRILSFFDWIQLVHVLITSIPITMGMMKNELVLELVLFFAHLMHSMSMMLTFLIVLDRWIAVKYCLHYDIYVTKRRINASVVLLGFINAAFFLLLGPLGQCKNTQKEESAKNSLDFESTRETSYVNCFTTNVYV